MNIDDLKNEARTIWAEERLTLPDVLIRLGVGFGDLCRIARGANKDAARLNDVEIKKELGNIIFSVIRWCDDLGYSPTECIELAKEAQKRFVSENNKH